MAQFSSVSVNGAVGLLSSRQMLAGNGKQYVVTNTTPGTAVAYGQQSSYSATANGLLGVQNTNASGGPNIYLDRLTLFQTATAPGGALVARVEAFNELGLVTLTTAVATLTPIQLNTGKPQATGAVVQGFSSGAATVPASVKTRRLQGIGAIQTGVAVKYDGYFVDFGPDGTEPGSGALTAARATAPALLGCQMPPVVIAPQTTTWLNLWWLAIDAAPSFEFALTYAEV